MIIGTAGHIDHGKTALVKALSGVDTDRLKEEKQRGITVDLGFAYLEREARETLGFVDVPGHDRFIRNMLAGATGIDFVLLVIAADDGIMPQTREHLAILDLLGLSQGVVALSKCDLVDQARVETITQEIAELLQRTSLEGAPVFPVSTETSAGISSLKDALLNLPSRRKTKDSQKLFRLSVDRCSSLKGSGTIVTGPVVSGKISVGETVIVSPCGFPARVRSIHAQNQPVREGMAGQRCALNLSGEKVNAEAISRGDFVVQAAAHRPAQNLDCELRLLRTETRAMQHWTPVRLHHGAAEISARLALLQKEDIQPGETGNVQLVLDRPVAVMVGDRFVIRDTSGERTLGGGRVFDLRGPRRRRKTQRRLAQVAALTKSDLATCLTDLLDVEPFFVDLGDFAHDRALSTANIVPKLRNIPHFRLHYRRCDYLFSAQIWTDLKSSILTALQSFHQKRPQIAGVSAAWLCKNLSPRLPVNVGREVINMLVDDGVLATKGGVIRLPSHRQMLDESDRQIWQSILPHLSGENRFRPTHGRECAALSDLKETEVRRVLTYLGKQQEIIELAKDRYFLPETLREIAGIVLDISDDAEDGWFPAASLRDRLENGRKVSIEILEYFDRYGLTVRKGDLRKVVPRKIEEFTASPIAREEENRPRWGVRTSNPGGAVSQS